MTNRPASATRRQLLRTGALVCAVGVAGCSGGGGSDSNGENGENSGSGNTTYGGWLDGAQGYGGSPTDRTGRGSVTVSVGAGNGLAFEPAAVEVSPGTTVVWEWTGQGGQHNVKEEDGAFESELASTEGTTFEHTFEEAGVTRYLCVPHEAVGMKGVVDVVEE